MTEPTRLKERPHHGPFPIPYVTAIVNGVPDFKIHDNEKRVRCAERNLCQLCGGSLAGVWMAFVGHEGSIERGRFGEPPMHQDCMEFAWEVCPWLAGRDWRLDYRKAAEGLTILPPPPKGKLGIWIATSYSTIPDDEGGGVIKWVPSQPVTQIEWRNR